jgi:hypothetical protein
MPLSPKARALAPVESPLVHSCAPLRWQAGGREGAEGQRCMPASRGSGAPGGSCVVVDYFVACRLVRGRMRGWGIFGHLW